MDATFFASAAAWRSWLARHHADTAAIVVGLHRTGSGRGGLTYPEALDEALCWGWIDGVRRKLDATSYSIRFTPRRPRSSWSRVNLRHAARLRRAGRMLPAGLAALAARDPGRSAGYSFEQRQAVLDAASARALRADAAAWTFFRSQPPGYRRTATWWVVSAKRPDTRARRLRTLITCSARRERIPPLAGPRKE